MIAIINWTLISIDSKEGIVEKQCLFGSVPARITWNLSPLSADLLKCKETGCESFHQQMQKHDSTNPEKLHQTFTMYCNMAVWSKPPHVLNLDWMNRTRLTNVTKGRL